MVSGLTAKECAGNLSVRTQCRRGEMDLQAGVNVARTFTGARAASSWPQFPLWRWKLGGGSSADQWTPCAIRTLFILSDTPSTHDSKSGAAAQSRAGRTIACTSRIATQTRLACIVAI